MPGLKTDNGIIQLVEIVQQQKVQQQVFKYVWAIFLLWGSAEGKKAMETFWISGKSESRSKCIMCEVCPLLQLLLPQLQDSAEKFCE